MNKNIIKALACSAVALTACDYNEKNFKDLDEMLEESSKVVETKAYTLAEADYKTAGSNTTYFRTNDEAISGLVKYVSSAFSMLDNGSAVNVACNVATEESEIVSGINNGMSYTLTADDYKTIWGETPAKYISPATEAKIADVLASKIADAEKDTYVGVTYKFDNYEPNAADDEVTAEYTKVAEIAEGNYVIAANNDGKYYAFGYFADASKTYGYCESAALTLNGNKLEDALEYAVTLKKTELGYAVVRSDNKCLYLKGTYNSFNIGDYPVSEGGDFTFTANDGKYAMVNVAMGKTVKYDASYNSYGAYDDKKLAETKTPMLDVEVFKESKVVVSKCESIKGANKYALYKYDGSKWTVATEATMLSAEDYTAMGQKYGNLSSTALPADYLPAYLNNTVAYPTEGMSQTVAYFYYGTDKTTTLRADEYIFENGKWTKPAATEEKSFQIVKANGAWMYDPSVVINLPAGKGIEVSATFYQAATDWVWENVDTKNGIATKGDGYVTSYGNNEYYTGSSAYQNNVDWRVSAITGQYADGFAGMSEEEILETVKNNLIEVYSHVLAKLYPTANAIEGLEVTYTINFVVYDGASHNYQIVYKVTGPATFEYVEDSLTEL